MAKPDYTGKEMGGKRAKDFVRCHDPACSINKEIEKRRREYPNWPERGPHCHPVF